MLRYNDYTNDPLSRCDCKPPYSAENTIAARSDLNPADGVYPFGALGHRDHGATDMKVSLIEFTHYFLFFNQSINFISLVDKLVNDSKARIHWYKRSYAWISKYSTICLEFI